MTRKIISLNDANWRFGSVPQKPFGDVNDLATVNEWLPAQVPGDVRLDLLRAGMIMDPFVAKNNEQSQWVDRYDWWYVRDLDQDLEQSERAFLIFEGIDYQSAVFVNSELLGRHVGMFSRQVYQLPIANGQLAIRIWGSDALPKMRLSPRQKIWKRLVKPLFSPPNEPFPDRYATLKCQMQFGWDFAPRLRTCGIWDDTQIVIARSVLIEDIWVKVKATPALTGGAGESKKLKAARVEVCLTLDADRGQSVQTVCNVRGKNFSSDSQSFAFNLKLNRGKQERELEFDLEEAREWNPWDRGDPNLYEIEIQIRSDTDEQLDSFTTAFGIRSFQLVCEGTQQDPWTLIFNGKREFIRGANWVPLDAIPGRLKREDYAARLRQVRDANINFLRVWGGGLREKRAFYDLCDELGILVWQEFPFAGAILDRFPRNREFLNLVDGECSAIVRALRNHPSLVVWCGGNEFNTRGNRAIIETLRKVVSREDSTRPFKPASPYRDESHNWRVWHHLANVRDYKRGRLPFLSEFGLQSAPKVESLEKFLPSEVLFPPNAMWEYHCAELKKLERYTRPALTHASAHLKRRAEVGLEEYVAATQRVQASALQIAIEHMRRRKMKDAAGVAIWQFNDCWPSISWSVVDYYGVPKQSYHALKRACSPVLASFDYSLEPRRPGRTVHGSVWIINDLRSSFANAQLTASLNGKEIFSQRMNIAPDSAECIDTLAVPFGNGENVLRLKLNWGPAPLSENEYDLNYYDEGEINPLIAMYVAIGNRLMR